MLAHAPLLSVLGVPTSAGSHHPGQEKAPAAWREAGLIGALRAAGLDVEDRGDLPVEPFRPVQPADGLRDADRVAGIARRVATEVTSIRAAGRVPLVLFGYLDRRCDSYLVHFDVDVLHTGLFPLADFPHFAGLTLDEAGACLDEFTSGEKFGGLVITEVNPGHDPSGELLRTLAARVTRALTRPADQRGPDIR